MEGEKRSLTHEFRRLAAGDIQLEGSNRKNRFTGNLSEGVFGRDDQNDEDFTLSYLDYSREAAWLESFKHSPIQNCTMKWGEFIVVGSEEKKNLDDVSLDLAEAPSYVKRLDLDNDQMEHERGPDMRYYLMERVWNDLQDKIDILRRTMAETPQNQIREFIDRCFLPKPSSNGFIPTALLSIGFANQQETMSQLEISLKNFDFRVVSLSASDCVDFRSAMRAIVRQTAGEKKNSLSNWKRVEQWYYSVYTTAPYAPLVILVQDFEASNTETIVSLIKTFREGRVLETPIPVVLIIGTSSSNVVTQRLPVSSHSILSVERFKMPRAVDTINHIVNKILLRDSMLWFGAECIDQLHNISETSHSVTKFIQVLKRIITHHFFTKPESAFIDQRMLSFLSGPPHYQKYFLKMSSCSSLKLGELDSILDYQIMEKFTQWKKNWITAFDCLCLLTTSPTFSVLNSILNKADSIQKKIENISRMEPESLLQFIKQWLDIIWPVVGFSQVKEGLKILEAEIRKIDLDQHIAEKSIVKDDTKQPEIARKVAASRRSSVALLAVEKTFMETPFENFRAKVRKFFSKFIRDYLIDIESIPLGEIIHVELPNTLKKTISCNIRQSVDLALRKPSVYVHNPRMEDDDLCIL